MNIAPVVPLYRIKRLALMVMLAFLLLVVLLPTGFATDEARPEESGDVGADFNQTPAAPPLKILIVHDQAEDPQLAKELAALLGHFSPVNTSIVEEAYYEPGYLEGFDAVFYLGGTHWSVSPAFLADVHNTDRTVVWMGRGLDWLKQKGSLDHYGIDFVRIYASSALTEVRYKDTALPKANPVSTIVSITDPNKARVLAWLEGNGQKEPYAVQSGNFWFFADVPMVAATEGSAYLVLADLLHDILNRPHAEKHSALVRIEDIHPNTDVGRFEEVVDYLYYNDIPFGVALVPVYRNPATGEEVRLSERPDLVKALKQAQARGGAIILHGYTHQLHGETVVDYEFWERETHAPPPDETAEENRERIEQAIAEVNSVGIYPLIWETPHYAASEMTHDLIAEKFPYLWERRDAPFFPYPVILEKTGQTILPETLGYINPREGHSSEWLIDTARQQLVVRDGYAAFFFHPMIGLDQLRQTDEGLRSLGYSFESPLQTINVTYHPPAPPSWYSSLIWHTRDRIERAIPDGLISPGLLTILALFIIFYYWGIFLLSRKPAPVNGGFDEELQFFIIIPALNEELVIARTLDHLLALPDHNLTILVVDDASEDRTREIALSYAAKSKKVEVIEHPAAVAQQGKGRVLNYAFKYLMDSETVREKGAAKVIMGVLDADGRVEPHIIEAVNPYFSDPKAGAVQVGVNISNANTNILTRWQNFEFLTFARISQKAREHLGSVGLGGNGQFVRLSALASLGKDPWTDCLTEDLDLGIRIMLAGWRNHYCPDSFVSQQGVPKMRPLIRQRTRWFQGHLTCWRHIPALMARRESVIARTDTIYYLLAPILVFLFLPSSILFVIFSIYYLSTGAPTILASPSTYIPALLIWYLFSFGALPTVVWTFWREEKGMSAIKAFFWAHLFAFFYIFWFIAGCKAIYRIALGRGSWAKTARTEETPGPGSLK